MRIYLLLQIVCCVALTTYGQDEEYVTNSKGENVVLYSDGTWGYRKDFNFTKVKRTLLRKPSFTGNTLDSGKAVSSVKLKKVFEESSSDYKPDAWLKRNDLQLNSYIYSMSKMNYQHVPHKIPTKYEGSIITQRFVDSNYNYVVYEGKRNSGRYLVILNKALDSVVAALDFYYYQKAPVSRKYGYEGYNFTSQGIAWLSCINDTLYVSTHHRTYSDSSEGKNGYITCLDLKTNKVVWRSQPLISNASSFALYGDYIFSGYGFTEEDDYIYCLNRYTGQVVLKHKLKKGPDYIILKDDQLYVRTYDKNYVFDIIDSD